MTTKQTETTGQFETIIIGLGNPILGDDGLGWRVAERVRECLQQLPECDGSVEVECLSVGGLALMERMVGYRRAILIDAITIGEGEVGDLQSVPLDALPDLADGHLDSAHDSSLQAALALGREMGYELPCEIRVVGVRTGRVLDFSDRLSEPVEAAVRPATEAVLELLLNGAIVSEA